MKTARKRTGMATSMPGGIAIGTIISLLITLIGCGIIAYMVSQEKIGEGAIGYGAMIVLFVASVSGALISVKLTKRLRLQTCMIAGVAYFASLISLTALFFGSRFQGMGVTGMIILGGVGLIAFLPNKKDNIMRKRKKAYR